MLHQLPSFLIESQDLIDPCGIFPLAPDSFLDALGMFPDGFQVKHRTCVTLFLECAAGRGRVRCQLPAGPRA